MLCISASCCYSCYVHLIMLCTSGSCCSSCHVHSIPIIYNGVTTNYYSLDYQIFIVTV